MVAAVTHGAVNVQPCRSCKAPIFWAETARGAWIPIDEKPVVDGNLGITLVQDGRITRAHARALRQNDLFDSTADRYVSHFATCPDAPQWRREQAINQKDGQ